MIPANKASSPVISALVYSAQNNPLCRIKARDENLHLTPY